MADTKSKWQLPQKNVEEKDSKTVALISLLVTAFFLFCCNRRSKYTSHTKKLVLIKYVYMTA